MKCPVCKRKVSLKNNPYRPFCSKECKLVDLYNWLNEEYKIKEGYLSDKGLIKKEGEGLSEKFLNQGVEDEGKV